MFRALHHIRRRVLYVDNCSVHMSTAALEKAADTINAEIHYFPKNTTHLIQPYDLFDIQKIISAWSPHWEASELETVKKGM